MSILSEFTTVRCPYEAVPNRLDRALNAVGHKLPLTVPIGDLRLEKDVEIHLTPKPGYPGYQLLDVQWDPEGGPYPSFHGTLSIGDEGGGWSRVELDGEYRPPFGMVGAMFDATLGRRIAEATALQLLLELKRRISNPAP